jgi:hypothetical protein
MFALAVLAAPDEVGFAAGGGLFVRFGGRWVMTVVVGKEE